MKKIVFIFIIMMFFMVSCHKKSDDVNPEKTTPFALALVDENGIDLLNPENPDAFNFNSMRLYYIKDGIKEEVYKQLMTFPRNISLHCDAHLHCDIMPSNISCTLGMFLSDSTVFEILNTNISDTICVLDQAKIIRYNDQIVVDANDPVKQEFFFIRTVK